MSSDSKSKLTKRERALVGKIDTTKLYPLEGALALVKEFATAKFDESIDVSVQLGIDAKKSDQVVRGAVVLPGGTGKTKRVAVFAQGVKADEARAAGADIVGMDDLAAEIKSGKMDFDIVIASPDTMRIVGTLTRAQIEEIAKTKMKDLNAASLDAAVKIIAGSARSMGVTVEGA